MSNESSRLIRYSYTKATNVFFTDRLNTHLFLFHYLNWFLFQGSSVSQYGRGLHYYLDYVLFQGDDSLNDIKQVCIYIV